MCCLALAAGFAVRAAIEQVDARVTLDLKWPNDVLIDGKKVCGILTEMNAEATRVRYIVVGIGINVNQPSFPKELETKPHRCALATGSEWSRVELAAALLKSLDQEYRLLAEQHDARRSILRRFTEQFNVGAREADPHRRKWLRVEGTTEGLDHRGFLQVRTHKACRRF